jgi:transmembrane 9 superfamily protein 2/4
MNCSEMKCAHFLYLVFSLFGIMSPANRGSVLTTMLTLYISFSFIAGYVSAAFYKMIGGQAWKKNIAMTALLIPG